jgi:hypothetical protein
LAALVLEAVAWLNIFLKKPIRILELVAMLSKQNRNHNFRQPIMTFLISLWVGFFCGGSALATEPFASPTENIPPGSAYGYGGINPSQSLGMDPYQTSPTPGMQPHPSGPTSPTGAPDNSPNDPAKNLLKYFKEDLLPVIERLPAGKSLSSFIADYESIIQAGAYSSDGNIGMSNAGLAKTLKEIYQKDRELGLVAANFYEDIHQLDKLRNAKEGFTKKDLPLKLRPSLASNSSGLASIEPGWLWNLALRFTEGDPNKAMRLIAVCGHDDVAQGVLPSTQSIKSVEKAKSLRKIRAAAEREIDRIEKEKEIHKSQSQVSTDLRHFLLLTDFALEAIDREQPLNSASYGCPSQDSAFYLPEAIGSEFKTPEKLKNRLVRLQAPGEGAEALPAKQYHIYGSAFVTCEMIQKGYPPILLKRAQKMLGWAYRTQRMNTIINAARSNFEFPKRDSLVPAEMSEEDWKREFENSKIMRRNFLINANAQHEGTNRYILEQFEAYQELPHLAPWNSMNNQISGLKYESLKLAKKAFENFLANPAELPVERLTMEEFRKLFVQGPFVKKSSTQDSEIFELYRGYLDGYEVMKSKWKVKGSEPKKIMPSSIPPALGFEFLTHFNPIPAHDFSSVEDYKKWKLKRWEESKPFRDRILRSNSSADAAYLMESWTLSKSVTIAGKKIPLPYTNITLPIPEIAEDTKFESWFRPRPKDWSRERYQRAKNRVRSWLVDWDWTVAQQGVGADFAAKNCRPPKSSAAQVDAMGNPTGMEEPDSGISAK